MNEKYMKMEEKMNSNVATKIAVVVPIEKSNDTSEQCARYPNYLFSSCRCRNDLLKCDNCDDLRRVLSASSKRRSILL